MASQNVYVRSGNVMDLVNGNTGATTNLTGDWKFKDAPSVGIQAILTGTGAVTATVTIQVSNDGANPCNTPLGTITLSGTSPQSDGIATASASWKYIRAVISGISGTNATVFVKMCA
jgi:hypothetical protein